jgi:hypothetical protein
MSSSYSREKAGACQVGFAFLFSRVPTSRTVAPPPPIPNCLLEIYFFSN